MARILDTARRCGAAAREPVDAASVAVFRIALGVAVVVNAALYLPVLVREYYVDTTFHFGYEPFTFVQPPPGYGMHAIYVAMAATGVCIALGWRTRWAAAGLFVTNTFIFLADSSFFQNHEYLLSLLALLLVALPTDRRWSLAARAAPERPPTVARGVVWLLRFQIGVPYFYGGLAKFNSDWYRGEPLRMWLAERTDIGPIDAVLTTEWAVMGMAWGALVFDLAIVALLLHPRTRRPAFVVAVCFHVTNAWLFGLFIFPWLMIAATIIFFPPTWPHGTLGWLAARAPALGPARGRGPWTVAADGPPVAAGEIAAGPRRRRRLVPVVAVAACTLWVGTQLLVPLRHHAIEGNPSWTEQAHRFSWHMRLRDKGGWVRLTVDDGVRSFQVDPDDHLGTKQAARLPGHPERLVQFARHLSELHGGAEVRAETMVSLNGRDQQPFVDPDVDLASVTYESHRPNDWVLPLEEPLR